MSKKISVWFWAILLLEYLFIFTFILNYDLAWMNPEKFHVHRWILSNGPHWKAEDWGRSLNIDVIECNPYRLSRPLSNLVEIVDTKWRSSLWKITTPHPALSLQWPFMFILLPWLLYQTLANMGCFPFVALTGVCVYMASVGFLGPLAMLFHPAKNLANFFAVLSIFFFSLSYKRLPSFPKKGAGGILFAGYLSLFMGFISDETGLYMYLVTIVLFHQLWRCLWQERRYGLLSGLFLLPLLYLLSIKFFLPYLHWMVRRVRIHLGDYDCLPSFKSLFWPDWNNLWLNTQFLFADHPHFLINYKQLSFYPWLMGIQIIYLEAALLLIFLFFKALPKSDSQQKTFLTLIAAGILLMIGYCFFQTFQLSLNVKVWGVWYYGSLFSLIYIFLLAFFLQFVYLHYKWLCQWSVVFALIFVLNGLAFGTYRMAAFKHQNIDARRYPYMKIFEGTLDPYQLFSFHGALERNYCKEMYTHLYWRRWKHLPEDVDHWQQEKCYFRDLVPDFYFMHAETGYLNAELSSPLPARRLNKITETFLEGKIQNQ